VHARVAPGVAATREPAAAETASDAKPWLELSELFRRMAPEDRERLLDLARRLSR
jgi:hypothetical protein